MTKRNEQRGHHRRSSNLSAQAVFGDQSPALECTVQDISPSGAKIAFAASDKLPLEFVLEVLALDLRVKARLVRSQGKCHRVEFHWAQKQGGCEGKGIASGRGHWILLADAEALRQDLTGFGVLAREAFVS